MIPQHMEIDSISEGYASFLEEGIYAKGDGYTDLGFHRQKKKLRTLLIRLKVDVIGNYVGT